MDEEKSRNEIKIRAIIIVNTNALSDFDLYMRQYKTNMMDKTSVCLSLTIDSDYKQILNIFALLQSVPRTVVWLDRCNCIFGQLKFYPSSM